MRAKRERPGRQEGASTVEGTRWLAGLSPANVCTFFPVRYFIFIFSFPYFLISFQAISYIKCNRPCKRRRSLKRQRKEIGRKKGKKMDDSPGDMSLVKTVDVRLYTPFSFSIAIQLVRVCAFGAIVFFPQPYTYSTQDDCTRYAQRGTRLVSRHSKNRGWAGEWE